MKKLLLILGILFTVTQCLVAQPNKGMQPTATKSLVMLQLRDFAKKPIAKAPIQIDYADQEAPSPVATGKTDRDGNYQVLVPIGHTYWISVGDSTRFNQLTIPSKPYSITKHTVYFQGSINGQPLAVGVPAFNMMPPSDGQAVIDIELQGLQGQPLVQEVVTLIADGSKKEFRDSTGPDGKLRMQVPIGENYTLNLAYQPALEHFSFPAHGGSYNVRVRYGYAGKQAIEDARAKRAADEAAYNAYMHRTREEQLKTRDPQGHKLEFRETPISKAEPPFKVLETNYGYALSAEWDAPVATPYYVDGLLVAGAGWGSKCLAAMEAATGKPVWSVKLEESGISNIEGGDDVIVCATESCTIYAIAAKTGKLLWSKWLATYVLSAPCVADGKVYLCYEDRQGSALLPEITQGKEYAMACFDLHTGAILWQQWIAGEVMSSAVAMGKNLYFNTFAGYSYVLNAETGRVLAAGQLYGTSAPIVVNGQLCMSQRDANSKAYFERIALFDATNLALVRGSEFQLAPYLDPKAMLKTQYAAASNSLSLGTGYSDVPLSQAKELGPKELVGSLSIFTTQCWEGSRPLEYNGKLYMAQSHVLECRDAKTLARIWQWEYPKTLQDDGAAQISPPIVAAGKIVVACMDGAIREFDPATGRITQNFPTGEKLRQQPIAARGSYYAPSIEGKLAVVNTGNPAVDKWHCWGGNARRTNRTE